MTDMISPHFSRAEMACRGSGELKLQPGFLDSLEALRAAYGQPMIVTSGCRTLAYNRAIRGHPRSLHLIDNPHHGTDTCAVDIKRPSASALAHLLRCALREGWSVGIAESFIHLDRRSAYLSLSPVVYTY